LLWCLVIALLIMVEFWLIINIADVSLIHEREHRHLSAIEVGQRQSLGRPARKGRVGSI